MLIDETINEYKIDFSLKFNDYQRFRDMVGKLAEFLAQNENRSST